MPEHATEHAADNPTPELDEIIARHFGGPARGASPKPAAEEPPPSDDDEPEGKPAEEPEDEKEEEEEQEPEAGDQEPDDEETEEEDEEDDEPEEEKEEEEEEGEKEDVLENVTAEELQRIEADPALKRLHRLMQRDYTTKTTDVAERDRTVTLREQEITQFEADIRTPEGLAGYIAEILKRKPDVVSVAFEAAATGDRAHDFLVAVGEEHPEVFEKAYERVQEILGDEDVRKRYHREREAQAKELDLQRRELRLRRARFETEFTSLVTTAEKEAKRLGIEKDDVPEVLALLRERLHGRVRDDGSISLSRKDVRTIAQKYKESLDRQLERVRLRLEQKQAKDSLDRTKAKARKAKEGRRSVPGAPPRKPTKEQKAFRVPEGVDPLDAIVEHRIRGA